ncbi:NAD-DEPENDENT DNA LIGASE [Fusobacterium vincentii ATCC 49256]|uniref:NAD-DEPENDENT DNA LIGASE n=1 Tax=Fusobacterium vincentii ATCC 49256 TaxID=209882 RepID=Q7P2A7_FUSVC|nr:NAD-DEPENDENT DNA LIGASE [Fusobacterium vincentii ATCC 49256]
MEITKRIEELKNNQTGLTLYSSQELNDLEKIVKLREDLDKYRNSYYNDNISLISDYEFDMSLTELESLKEKYPSLRNFSSTTSWEQFNKNKLGSEHITQ